MIQSKKFGSFGGVFTPSILTILGVIMYMRLSWVVGQAGIIGVVGIILIAHIISVTTGLSISSIATDKKIKTGGIYYMLSRSLGLPIGGAIGIALFVGTALSISLYIIGFAESFLSLPFVAEFLNLEPNLNSYRIVGTGVISVLVILALISTSLVIKSQYLILSAIALSLISVFVGFSMHPEFIPDSPALLPAANDVSLEKVFSIFFPAVTGFTAGVAMSGDLRDPKKNIPAGTLLAITVGFIVYMSLAISFGLFIDREILIGNGNIIMDVAWVPQLVIAGIWGATLSSALGGILGAPRILQALSQDRVTPKFLGKGYGASNEPRNALLATFLIAEGGILIGSLDIIAGIVTMFYLASYGFINLAYMLEHWAGPDFRPSFRISKSYGIVGFIFAFAVMFKLDMLSMLAAFFIISLIFFVLQRRQLQTDSGDVWQSVWVSVVRRGLFFLNKNRPEDRNWQPNIILFSGGTEKRKHLINFGGSLVGKYGLLSNFELIEDSSDMAVFPKYNQPVSPKEKSFPGLFTRRLSCKNVYEGVEMVARAYGFSGIEPNTIILGWARNTEHPKRFVSLLQTVTKLDYNILLVDYDKRVGFGNYKQIDIWWRGAGNNGNFALSLAKFMLTSEQWANAKIRLMIVSSEQSKTHYIYRQAKEILNNMRLKAEVKVVNNEINPRPFYDIIRTESKNSDLVYVGIPEIMSGKGKEFIEKTNRLLRGVGTVVLLRASASFKELNLGINISQQSVISESHNFDLEEKIAKELIDSRHPELNREIRQGFKDIISLHEQSIATVTFKEFDSFLVLLQNTKALTEKLFESLIAQSEKENFSAIRAEEQSLFIEKVNKHIETFKKEQLPVLYLMMSEVLSEYNKQKESLIKDYSDKTSLHFKASEINIKKSDPLSYRLIKQRSLMAAGRNGQASITINSRAKQDLLQVHLFELLYEEMENIRIESFRFLYRFAGFVKHVIWDTKPQQGNLRDTEYTQKQLEQAKINCRANYKRLESDTKSIVTAVAANRKDVLVIGLNDFLKNTENPDDYLAYRDKMRKDNRPKLIRKQTEEAHQVLFDGFEYYSEYTCQKNNTALYGRQLMSRLNGFVKTLNKQESLSEKAVLEWLGETKKYTETIAEIFPEFTELMNEESMNSAFYEKFKPPKTFRIPLRRTVKQYTAEYIIAEMEKASEQATKLINEGNSEQAKKLLLNQSEELKYTVSFLNARQFLSFYEQKNKTE
jgi:amino acid transporter